jgi:glycosyltransferase involved in cell wall biosynthesis
VSRALRRQGRLALHLVVGSATCLLFVAFVVPVARLRYALRRRDGWRPAILWGPIPIPNIRYSALADRLYGYRSSTLVFDVYRISSRSDFDYVLDRWSRFRGLGLLAPYGAFLWAAARFDIFGFFFDGGLLYATPFWRAELALLRVAGKKIVVYPYGGDARLPSATRAADRWNAYTDVLPGEEDREESQVRRRLDAFGRYANVVLGCNDLVESLPRCDGILRYPFDLRGWEPAEELDDGTVTVVHAANHRHYKGTRFVIQAVDDLRREGLPIELVLVEGVPNAEARKIYERADVIASDFLIGGYALFPIEAMALGKPVLCYMPDRLRPYHPEWEEVPIVSASPDTLANALRRLVLEPDLRRELGRRGPPYVQKYHSLEAVGADLDRIYRSLWDERRGEG